MKNGIGEHEHLSEAAPAAALGHPSVPVSGFTARQGPGARRASLRIALTYAAVAGAWILLSDKVMGLFPTEMVLVSSLKGLFFVAATAWMLYLLVHRQASALQRSEAQLRSTVESMVDGVVVADPGGRIVHANRAASAFLGSPQEASKARPAAGPAEAVLHRALCGEVVRGQPLEVVGPHPRHLSVSASPILEAGRPVGAVAVLRDESDRLQAQEARRRSELLAQHSRDAILFIRQQDGRIVEANAAAERLYGYGRAKLLAMTLQELRHPDELSLMPEQLARADAEGLLFETVHLRQDGTSFPVEVSAQGATIEQERAMVSVVRDISERRKAEEALREANLRKDEFLAMLSHELRNPLTPIRNCVYLLGRNASLDEAARRSVATVERQSAHLARLVEELLDATRIARGKIRLRLERLDLTALVRRSGEDYASLFAQRTLRLELPAAALWVSGDAERLYQALGNLLSNAAKFTGEGDRVTVRLTCAASGMAVLEVEDSGIGFEPSLKPRLFEPFMQADTSLDRPRGGLGLGLALVRGIVELHGGTIRGHSGGTGQGALFTVELPALAG